GDMDDAALIVLTAALLHDIGNQVHRENHSFFSAVLAAPILTRLLPKIYDHPEIAAEIRGFILHAIHSHEKEIPSLTTEASIICIADGCDMFKGRGRLPFDLGNVNIHTVSALSISNVKVEKGERRPVRIVVEMDNSAGIFQVQELLKEKIDSGVLSDKIEIVAMAVPPESTTDHRIVSRIMYVEGKFVPF
ncbi:MAG: phosphohydrolase, partial [Thermoprotei archaeon]